LILYQLSALTRLQVPIGVDLGVRRMTKPTKSYHRPTLVFFAIVLSVAAVSPAQLYLFSPRTGNDTYLMNRDGQIVWRWPGPALVSNAVYLVENGQLLRPVRVNNPAFQQNGYGGRIQLVRPDYSIAWDYVYSSDTYMQHHDICPMPNGNVLILAWEKRSGQEAIDNGRDPANLADGELWPERVVEVQPDGVNGGKIVWMWSAWDHLVQDFDETKANYGVVADNPRRIDINFGLTSGQRPADWLHANAISYNPETDQIILSIRTFSEIWVIDHSTTTEEAATSEGGRYGFGGDLLYRWGNPQAYDRGTEKDRKLFVQHNAQWVASGLPGAGNMMVFNNGTGRADGNYSTIEEWAPPVDENGNFADPGDRDPWGPNRTEFTYIADPPTSFYSAIISGVQRLPDGTTLICEGVPGRFFEIDPASQIVWQHVDGRQNFRVTRIEDDDPRLLALQEHWPTPGVLLR